jgi:hypothetical protein
MEIWNLGANLSFGRQSSPVIYYFGLVTDNFHFPRPEACQICSGLMGADQIIATSGLVNLRKNDLPEGSRSLP